MLRGHVDEITCNRVTGWAFDEADLRKTLNVDIDVNGRRVASPRADILRKDLEKEFGYGHHAFTFEFMPPLPIVRDHDIGIFFGGTTQLITRGERHLAAVAIEPARSLQPILVSASGRAGSTILMKKLATHAAVSVANLYPYETELLKYYGHAFSVLSSAGDHEKSGAPETFIENFRFLGANPFFVQSYASAFHETPRFKAFYESFVPRELARAFRGIVTEFYLSAAADGGKSDAVYFAEKCHLSGTARWFSRNLFGAVKEIVLVRDLRDTLCSFRSFWSTPTAESMRLLKISYDTIMAVRKEARSDVHFVRYEDLVLHEVETLKTISDFLGLRDFPPEDVESEKELFAKHGTSKSPAGSIGRWKRDLPHEEIKDTTRAFEPFLREFGYDV